MRSLTNRMPSPAIVVATLALVIALGAGAWAVTKAPKNSVVSKSIKNGQVKSPDLKDGGVTNDDLADAAAGAAEIADGAVGSAELAGGSVGTAQMSASIPAASVTRSSVQSIAASTQTPILFNQERWDTAEMHGAGDSVVTIPVSGIYELNAYLEWGPSMAGLREASIRRNSFYVAFDQFTAVEDTGVQEQELTTVERLDAGDQIELWVSQSSGGPLNVLTASNLTPELSVTWLAPG